MKKYYFNVFIFIFVLAVIFLSSSFVYANANKLREQTAADTVSDISRQVDRNRSPLGSDYNVFKIVSNMRRSPNLTPLDEHAFGRRNSGFGKIKEDIFNDGEDDFPRARNLRARDIITKLRYTG